MKKTKLERLEGVAIALLAIFTLYFGKDAFATFGEIRNAKEEIKVEVVDELKSIYDTEDVNVLDTLKNNKDYIKYEVLVEDVIKQVIYMKDKSDVVVIEQ